VLSIIDRFRDRGLTTPFDADVMVKAGVPESLANRTLVSLRDLGLVDDSGQPSEQLQELATARGDEYRQRLASILHDRYADIFAFVDPATDTMEQIQEAFRGYEPRGQRSRMVTLFLGLCQAAELAPETPKRSAPRNSVQRVPKPKPAPMRATRTASRATSKGATAGRPSVLPSALAGLLDELPQPGEGWTEARRDQFLTVFRSILDFSYPVRTHDLYEEIEFDDSVDSS
jgi:hypothetical protein